MDINGDGPEKRTWKSLLHASFVIWIRYSFAFTFFSWQSSAFDLETEKGKSEMLYIGVNMMNYCRYKMIYTAGRSKKMQVMMGLVTTGAYGCLVITRIRNVNLLSSACSDGFNRF